MATVTVKQKNPRALKNIGRQYRQSNNILEIGFPKELAGSVRYPSVRDSSDPSKFSKDETPPRVTDVAFTNEFGSASQHIPPRPFMRKSAKPTEILLKKQTVKLVRLLNSSKSGSNVDLKTKFLKLMGPKIVTIFRKTITNLSEPPNAPLTIALKKSSNPLVDTGLMRQTLTYLVAKRKKGQGN